MAVDYTQYLMPNGTTRQMPTNTITDIIRGIGGYQTMALTAAEKLRYAGFNQPGKTGPGHCFNTVEYNPDTRLARYQFQNGLRNYYKMMGPIQAQKWANAPSLGQHYNAFIKFKLNNSPLGRLFYGRR